jgi:transmembrane sensor
MDKNSIIEYLQGNATEEQKQALLEWIRKSPENAKYFASVKDLYVFSSMQSSDAGSFAIESKRTVKSRAWRLVALGVAASLLVALVVDIAVRSNSVRHDDDRVQLSEVKKDYIHTIYTEKGVKGEVTLPDGSMVRMNSDTRIVFPDQFTGSTREVFVSGEAYFDVVSNPDVPMIVTASKNFSLKVLGTAFNVRSYDNEISATATLYRGSIELTSKQPNSDKMQTIMLVPNQTYVINATLNSGKVQPADTVTTKAWLRGELIFDDTPMSDVIKELNRWYGTEFTVLDRTVYNTKLSADFKSCSIREIMDVIKFCSPIDYKITDNQVTLCIKNSVL